MSWPSRSLKVIGAALGGAFVYAAAIEPYSIEQVRFNLLCPHLPKAFDGFRVLQISDLHMRQIGRREKAILRLARAADADLIAVTGDMIHTGTGLAPFLEMFESLHAPGGVWAIFGNSEHKNGILPDELAKSLDDRGIVTLRNRSERIARGSDSIYICGTDDPVTYHADLERTLRGVPEDAFKLLLMHSPDNIAEAVYRQVDVVLSGHTHGGQIRLPIIGPPLTRSYLGHRMNSGYYGGLSLRCIVGTRPGRTQLYVSRGAGISGLALRFLCRPEIALITLRSL